MADSVQPGVIVLDVMMQKMNAFEVCQIIRSTAGLPEVPILMITTLVDGMELIWRLRGMARLNRYRLIAEQRREQE